MCHRSVFCSPPLRGLLVSGDTLICYRRDLGSQWKQRRMDSWKIMAAALTLSISAHATERSDDSYEKSMIMITLAPTTVLSATTGFSELAAKNFKPAKADALAFVGSDGDIRGAQFEQAVRYYRTTYTPPLMTDQQLALAIATSF